MAIKASPCVSYVGQCYRGLHRPDDTYKLALYDAGANLSEATKFYSAAHEVAASGTYPPGGGVLTGFYVDEDNGTLSFDDLVFSKATIAKAAGALIYNASKGDRAVAVLKFSETVSTVLGTFTVELPVPLLEASCVV